MKQIFTILSILLLNAWGSSPDPNKCRVKVTIQNNSDKNIYFNSGSGTPQIGFGYNPLKSGDYFKIVPNASKSDIFGRDRGCYEDLFKENNNKLYYLLYDEQVLLNEPWDTIVKYDKVLKRYSFTVEQMQSANWVIRACWKNTIHLYSIN